MITFEDGLQINLPDISASEALASALATALVPGLIIYLHGDLGAGKTTLVRAMLTALGCTDVIKSPTYTLIESYSTTAFELCHFDLYRLADAEELEFIGIRDYITANAVCIFEWADKGARYIPVADIEITLSFKGSGRGAALLANTAKGLEILQILTIGQQ